MRYLLFLCLLVLTLPVLGYNEVVSAISYNPSRLGAYTHLKAVETAKLAGGLSQNGGRLNILSKGTVTVQCPSGECTTNEIDNIKPVGALGESCEAVSSLCDGWLTSEKGGNLQGANSGGAAVFMYGGSLGKKEGGSSGTAAIIDAIALNNGATLEIGSTSARINTLTVQKLTIPNGGDNKLTLGNVTISAPSVSGGSYKFVTRVTDADDSNGGKRKRNVLCIK